MSMWRRKKPMARPADPGLRRAMLPHALHPGELPLTVSSDALLDGDGDGLSDARFRQMIYDLLHMEAQLREARDRLGAALGLAGPAYAILMTIARADEVVDGAAGESAGIRVRDVADRLHVSGAFVTAEANKLRQAGLVAKTRDPADGRAVRLRLTAEGRRRLIDLAPQIRAVNDHLFGDFTRDEFNILAKVAARTGRKSAAAFFDAFLPAA